MHVYVAKACDEKKGKMVVVEKAVAHYNSRLINLEKLP